MTPSVCKSCKFATGFGNGVWILGRLNVMDKDQAFSIEAPSSGTLMHTLYLGFPNRFDSNSYLNRLLLTKKTRARHFILSFAY